MHFSPFCYKTRKQKLPPLPLSVTFHRLPCRPKKNCAGTYSIPALLNPRCRFFFFILQTSDKNEPRLWCSFFLFFPLLQPNLSALLLIVSAHRPPNSPPGKCRGCRGVRVGEKTNGEKNRKTKWQSGRATLFFIFVLLKEAFFSKAVSARISACEPAGGTRRVSGVGGQRRIKVIGSSLSALGVREGEGRVGGWGGGVQGPRGEDV